MTLPGVPPRTRRVYSDLAVWIRSAWEEYRETNIGPDGRRTGRLLELRVDVLSFFHLFSSSFNGFWMLLGWI